MTSLIAVRTSRSDGDFPTVLQKYPMQARIRKVLFQGEAQLSFYGKERESYENCRITADEFFLKVQFPVFSNCSTIQKALPEQSAG